MRLLISLIMASLLAAADSSFTIAALTLTPEPWDKEANFAKLAVYARRAKAAGAQVIVAPEGYLEGYVGNEKRTPGLEQKRYTAIAEEIDGPLMRRVAGLAEELSVYLMVGFAERRGGAVYNSAVLFNPAGKVASNYAKSHTADDEPFNTKGKDFPVIQTEHGPWGTLICFDRQLPETARILALKGARLILVPAWGGYSEMNDLMMRVRAYENGVHLAFVHPKRALIINSHGKVLAQNDGERDQFVLARIQLDQGERPGPMKGRRPELYGDLVK